ncbi:MAG: 50S ribosomal protein L15 [Patescibacteria group bacterium]|jgi:large subunit ribosomal protein L15
MELALHNLKPNSRKRRRRVGRGNSSGRGTYSGKGIKGQNARSGGGTRPGFEGGRMPLIRQIPKSRGFRSFHLKFEVVNIGALEANFKPNELVTPAKMLHKKLITSPKGGIKVLGNGQLTKKLTIVADAFSKSAEDAIKKAGGSFKVRT